MKRYRNKTITKRTDGRWHVRFYENGKQVSIYGKTQAECYEKLKERLKQPVEAGKTTKATGKTKYTLKEWLDKWLELYKIGKIRDTTVQKLHYNINHLAPLFDRPIGALTSIELQEFFNAIDKPRMKQQVYTTLKDAMTKAFRNKLISENPFDVVDLPKHKAKQSRALTIEEEKRFTEECRSNSGQGVLFLLCLYEGLRIGEALALTYEDIDFEKRVIRIDKALDANENISAPKTDSSVRTVPLFKNAEEILDRNGSGKLFCFTRNTYQKTMIRICRKLNLENISVHSLRHTFATRCSEAGIPAKVVQKWLGHSTLNMTLNVYTHVNADFEQNEVKKFDTYFDTHFDTHES